MVAGVVLAFALLIAAVWASDVSAATSLALTGAIVLAGVGTFPLAARGALMMFSVTG